MSCQVLSDNDHTARKAHDCIWCREKIEIGQIYHVQVVVHEGDWQSNKYHPECFQAAIDFWREDLDGDFDAHAFERGTTQEATTRK